MPRGYSLLDSPHLRVSRPVSACARCRAAKVKCDGKLPACTACEKAHREEECASTNDNFARGKERSYVTALELEIERLEKRLTYARLRKASVAMHDPDVKSEPRDSPTFAASPTPEATPTPDSGRKDSLAVIRDAIHRKAARKRENSDVNTLVSDFGYMSVNATMRDFDPSVINITFARLVLAASVINAIPPAKTTHLPPKDVADKAVRFYMSNIYPLYPAFPESAVHTLLADLYQRDSPLAKSSESWLFWMVLAIGSAAQSTSANDQYYQDAIEFVARALPHADRALTPGYVTQIQSLLLLTQYSMLDPTHFESWHLNAFTCRAVVDLGFHQDPVGAQPSEELDDRRRTFYCVYSLDRAIGMVHARAFSFTDDAISVELPDVPVSLPFIDGATSTPDISMLVFPFRRMQSNWYQTLFQSDPGNPLPDAQAYIWQMCLEMRQWSEGLPQTVSVAFREMLDLELHYSYVYCIAPSSRAPHVTDYGRKLIYEYAIDYINQIHRVVHGANAAFYTYHDALKVYFLGSQLVAVLRDAADMLLSGTFIQPPVMPPGLAPAPPLRQGQGPTAEGDELDRSLAALERVSLVLEKYGERWENALQLRGSFEAISAEVIGDLKTRKEHKAAVQGTGLWYYPA